MSTESVVKSLNLVKTAIANTLKKLNSTRTVTTNYNPSHLKQVRLVAVSKTKPIELIEACYKAGHRNFGENYVQELCEKAAKLPQDIQWHFIGHLQSNKTKQIASVPNLFMVETVDREKIATALEKEIVKSGRKIPLNVMVQVNTSGEESMRLF